jgi:hypothetical protein
MSGLPWTKFYWTDYSGDPALRLCSLAAQGLWMRMLCVAAEHNPIGYVAVNGRGLDETDLAQLTGVSESEVKSLLAQLDRNGVFSRDRQRRIYNRRMVEDAKKSAIAKKNGKLGGNPRLGKQTTIFALDNPQDMADVKPQKPEARSQKENRSGDTFPEWYLAYPKHIGRGQAERAYRSALKKADSEVLRVAVQKFAAASAGKDPQFIPNPATWLNGERWLDEAPAEIARVSDASARNAAVKARYAVAS